MISENIVWLTVGGCPRSGTTALGKALNQHSEIALLHEYNQAHFWNLVNDFFSEEDRLSLYPSTNSVQHLIPNKKKHLAQIAKLLVGTVLKKEGYYIGTKFPGVHLWEKPLIPEWIETKEIHITRNPFDTILSYAKKNIADGLYPPNAIIDSAHEALIYWLSAYNHAISRLEDNDFCHLFYDEIINDTKSTSTIVSRFLNIDDIDLSGIKPINKTDSINNQYLQFNLHTFYNRIEQLFPYENWLDSIRMAMKNKEYLVLSNELYLGVVDIHYSYIKYICKDFYPAEKNGVWTKGNLVSIRFKPIPIPCNNYIIATDVTWAIYHLGEWPITTIYINNEEIDTLQIEMIKNGETRRFLLKIKTPIPEVIDIRYKIYNPKNPKLLGISDDDRYLGFFISKISIYPT